MAKKDITGIQDAEVVDNASEPAPPSTSTVMTPAEFYVHEVYTIHRDLVPSGILDKVGDRYHAYSAKERQAVARFVIWVQSEYTIAEKIREQILQSSTSDDVNPNRKNPTQQWNEAIMEKVYYPHSKLYANEDFFERVHLSNDAIGKLKGFIVIE